MSKALGYVMFGVAFALIAWARFGHAELTETQLLLALWPCWLLVVGLALGGYALIANRETQR